MNDSKLTLFVLGIGIIFVACIATIIFVVIPKDAFIESRVSSRVSNFKSEVNRCNKDGGSAYIADERIFCDRKVK